MQRALDLLTRVGTQVMDANADDIRIQLAALEEDFHAHSTGVA